MEVNPLNIFFVKSDSKGDRLLFRYPYTTENKDESRQKKSGRHNPYAINATQVEDLLQNPQSQMSNIHKGQLSGFTDEMLSTLFAVKAELCNQKFELKVNDVRFVGHPTLLPYRTNKDDNTANVLINIVFALQASASHSIVKCYYDLSRRLGKALRHEEKRCSYLTEEMKIMLAAHDEVSSMEAELAGGGEQEEENLRLSVGSAPAPDDAPPPPRSAFHLILQRSSLARSMKKVFEELSSTGIVQVRINKWVLLSFCLPHKAHQMHNRGVVIEPETIDKCLEKLRPYHGILLMVNPNELLASIPLDGSAALLRLIKGYSPLKSLQTLAIETDLSLTQVFQLTGHLVYWAKATVIYPLCEGNVYVVAPLAQVHVHSPLREEFAREFPGLCLLQMLGEFSLPAPLWYVSRGRAGGAGGAGGGRLARVAAWLLRRRLLLQLHTYVQLAEHWPPHRDGKEYFCEKHDTYNQSCNISYSSLNQMQLNVPEPINDSRMFPDSDEEYPENINNKEYGHTKPIVIESDSIYNKYEMDSANHSFDDGIDVVDAIVKPENGLEANGPKKHANSVDSGISNNVSGTNKGETVNSDSEKDKIVKSLPSRLSDLSLKKGENVLNSSGEVESDNEVSPVLKNCNGFMNASNATEKKNGVSLNLRLQNEMSFQPPTVWSHPASCEVAEGCGPCAPLAEPPSAEALLSAFSARERAALQGIPAARDPHDLMLLTRLHRKGYLRGEQHLEEIMYLENVSRAQLLQLLDKFKDVLITFETEDPAVAMLYPYN